MKHDFLSIADWSSKDLLELLKLSGQMKKDPSPFFHALEGQSIAMIFEKQSLRTHVTFDVAIQQLGAHAIYLTQADISLGKRESIHDVAKNLERWVRGIVIRTFSICPSGGVSQWTTTLSGREVNTRRTHSPRSSVQ